MPDEAPEEDETGALVGPEEEAFESVVEAAEDEELPPPPTTAPPPSVVEEAALALESVEAAVELALVSVGAAVDEALVSVEAAVDEAGALPEVALEPDASLEACREWPQCKLHTLSGHTKLSYTTHRRRRLSYSTNDDDCVTTRIGDCSGIGSGRVGGPGGRGCRSCRVGRAGCIAGRCWGLSDSADDNDCTSVRISRRGSVS